MTLASGQKIQEIIELKRCLVPGQDHFDDDTIKVMIRRSELYNLDNITTEAADELLAELKERVTHVYGNKQS